MNGEGPCSTGLLISSAGAGVGKLQTTASRCRLQSGNSVQSVLRPVDIPPFNDSGLLAKATASKTVPKIFYTFTSSAYWARAGSLTHTNDTGTADAPLAPNIAPLFPGGYGRYARTAAARPAHVRRDLPAHHELRGRALGDSGAPFGSRCVDARATPSLRPRGSPPSRRASSWRSRDVRFPNVAARFRLAPYVPPVWHMDFGPGFRGDRRHLHRSAETWRAISAARAAGGPRRQTTSVACNCRRLPCRSAPSPGGNLTIPEYRDLGYLGGLVGGFEPFARTKEARERGG